MKNIYEKIYKSDPLLLPEIEDFISKIINKLSIDENIKNNITLAVTEASANCMLHGNNYNINKNVFLKLKLTKNQILISFRDEGEGFSIDDVPDPTHPENLLKGNGRGIYIMKSVVDKIDYKFHDDGTEVVLFFNI